MIAQYRDKFNEQFSEAKYQNYLQYMNLLYPNSVDFRIAETPLFLPNTFKDKLLKVGEYVCKQIQNPDFKLITQPSLNQTVLTPNENELPACIVMDYGITYNDEKEMVPALIELQGFPSLFAFEVLQDEALRNSYEISKKVSPYLNGYNKESYLSHLHKIIKGENQEHTILLEIQPHQQKTRIDFYCTQFYLDIPIVCLTEIFAIEHQLFYKRNGKSIKIDRIYNRVVPEDLKNQSKEIQQKGEILATELDVKWVNHPHHFFRISKFLLPFLKHPFIPKTTFLTQLKEIPNDLENYIMKPLFSFAGQGVKINLSLNDLDSIKDTENWIIQEKVRYAPCIRTMDGLAKAEIRIFYLWDESKKEYLATMNLCRLSKSDMMGVQLNQTATDWVGGSLAYFEE